MEGKLYLTSGGYIDGAFGEKTGKVFEDVCSNRSVLLVDNATVTGSNTRGPGKIIKNFNNIGASVDQITLDSDNLDVLANYDIVYFTGGDCAPLAYLASNSQLKDKIMNYLSKGGVVIGESAGSILFGSSFKWYYDLKRGTKPKYDIELPSYDGLGIVSDYIYPHYNKASDTQIEKIREYCKVNSIKINCMEDDCYLEYSYLQLKKNNR